MLLQFPLVAWLLIQLLLNGITYTLEIFSSLLLCYCVLNVAESMTYTIEGSLALFCYCV